LQSINKEKNEKEEEEIIGSLLLVCLLKAQNARVVK